MSHTGLYTSAFKPQLWHDWHCHVVVVFKSGQRRAVDMSANCLWNVAMCLDVYDFKPGWHTAYSVFEKDTFDFSIISQSHNTLICMFELAQILCWMPFLIQPPRLARLETSTGLFVTSSGWENTREPHSNVGGWPFNMSDYEDWLPFKGTAVFCISWLAIFISNNN